MTASCSGCRQPVRCCVGFHIPIHAETALDLPVALATTTTWGDESESLRSPTGQVPDSEVPNLQLGLPFMPLVRQTDGAWRLWCPELQRDGKCGIYDDRPAVCRNFVPASNPLCIEYTPCEQPHAEELMLKAECNA